MTEGLSEAKVKWLTYLVYILLFVEGMGMLYLQNEQNSIKVAQASLPEKYVMLEQYRCDQKKAERVNDRILALMDRIDEELRKR